MSAAEIRIGQLGAFGAAGVSRDDLVVDEEVTLENADDTGARTWRWRLVDRPPTSSAVIAAPTAPSATFTPDVPGSYLVELAIDEGQAGQVDRRVCAVREDLFGTLVRVPAAGEDNEANWDSNGRGWTPDVELWLRTLAEAIAEIDVELDPDSVTNTHLANMAGCTFKGRGPNSTGDPQDIATANGQWVGRRADVLGAFTLQASDIPAHASSHNTGGGDALTALSAAILTSGSLPAARLPEGPGIVTPAKLDDAPGYSALVRSTGTTGVRGNEVCGEDEFLGRAGSGDLQFQPINVASVVQTLYDIDLTAESTVALANGAFPIGGLPFICDDATRAGASSGLLNGTGLTLRAPTSQANTWTVTSQDAPHLYLPVSDIEGFLPGIDTLIIDMHIGASSVFELGNDCVRMGLWGLVNTPVTGAAARARIADKGNHSAVQTLRTFDGTNVTTTAIDFSGDNAYSVIIFPSGEMVLGTGDYSGGWPARFTYFWRFGTLLTTDSYLGGDGLRFLLTLINASDASPTTRVDIAHLRLRKKSG